MNGVAMRLAAGSYLSPLELLANSTTPYPPGLMGLRGSHLGSFEVGHAVSLRLKPNDLRWREPDAMCGREDCHNLSPVW